MLFFSWTEVLFPLTSHLALFCPHNHTFSHVHVIKHTRTNEGRVCPCLCYKNGIMTQSHPYILLLAFNNAQGNHSRQGLCLMDAIYSTTLYQWVYNLFPIFAIINNTAKHPYMQIQPVVRQNQLELAGESQLLNFQKFWDWL